MVEIITLKNTEIEIDNKIIYEGDIEGVYNPVDNMYEFELYKYYKNSPKKYGMTSLKIRVERINNNG